MSMTGKDDPVRQLCAFCGRVLGVYEPLILIGEDRRVTRTSRLAHRESPVAGVILHEDCYERSRSSAEDRSP